MRVKEFLKGLLAYACVATLAVGSLTEYSASTVKAADLPDIILDGDEGTHQSSMIGEFTGTDSEYTYLGWVTFKDAKKFCNADLTENQYKYLIMTYAGDIEFLRFEFTRIIDESLPADVTNIERYSVWFNPNEASHFVTYDGVDIPFDTISTEKTTLVLDLSKVKDEYGYEIMSWYNDGIHIHTGAGNIKAEGFRAVGEFKITSARLSTSPEIKDIDSMAPEWMTPSPTYTEWIITKDPTCTTHGERVRYFAASGEVAETESIEPLGHIEIIDEAVEATCTESGLGQGSHCSRCNEILVEQEIISETGHTVSSKWETIKMPECIEDGLQIKKCTVCNEEILSKLIDATGHSIVVKEATEATCTTAGKTEGSYCLECGEIFAVQKYVEPKGHTVVIDKAIEATCTQIGKTEGTHCSVCEQVLNIQKNIDALGHKETEPKNKKIATYFNTGYTGDIECETCGKTLKRGKTIAKLKLAKPIVKTKAGKKKITVTIGKVTGAKKYEIKIKIGKKWKKYTTSKTRYTIKKLQKGKKYKVKVRAVTNNGKNKAYSSYSKTKTVKVK